MESKPQCTFFFTTRGCNKGNKCKFSHVANLEMCNNVENTIAKLPLAKNVYCCSFCQTGNCDMKPRINVAHIILTPEDKNLYFKKLIWHYRLAKKSASRINYLNALGAYVKNEKLKANSERKSIFTFNGKNGILTAVIPVIFKGDLAILNPPLIFLLNNGNTTEKATWCEMCMGAKRTQCAAFEMIQNSNFEPASRFTKFGCQLDLAVTMTEKGLKIHSPMEITLATHEVKSYALKNNEKDYIDLGGASSECDVGVKPIATVFDNNLIAAHKNTEPTFNKFVIEESKHTVTDNDL